MNSAFQPDNHSHAHAAEPSFVGPEAFDPESFDSSEQQFTASLEKGSPAAAARFIPDDDAESAHVSPVLGDEPQDFASHASEQANSSGTSDRPDESAPLQQPALLQPDDGASWRQEVASRVDRYRSRRRSRGPRYPSLQLEFETAEKSWQDHIASRDASNFPASNLSVAMHPEFPEVLDGTSLPLEVAPDTAGKILPFPRMTAPTPPVRFDELADPIFDRPRIMEVPEVAPPPPALGGILMEPAEDTGSERRPGFELPLQAASLSRRFAAVFVDSLLVGLALSGFAYAFFRITRFIPPLIQAAAISAVFAGAFWFFYQYLLLVFSGTTPGLKLARLQLHRFDGSAVPRSLRRWRVLASALSGLSLGLGYAWCFLDEDQLCWHDRITRTYMGPRAEPEEPA